MTRWIGLGVLGLGAMILAAWMFWGTRTPIEEHKRQQVETEVVQTPAPAGAVIGRRTPPPSPTVEEPVEPEAAPDAPKATPTAREEVLAGVTLTVWPMDRDGIRGAIREVEPAIKICYEAVLKEHPHISGKLVVDFEVEDVEGIGKVTSSRIEDESFADGPTAECVQLAMEALQFDAPAAGGVQRISYPFIFRSY